MHDFKQQPSKQPQELILGFNDFEQPFNTTSHANLLDTTCLIQYNLL